MQNFEIRKATSRDAEIIADLSSKLNQSQGMTEYHRPDVNILRDNFEYVDVYIAEAENQPIGFVAGFKHFNPHNSYFRFVVSSIFVNEEYRRAGIGAALLRTLILDKQKEKIQQFAIDVLPSSEAARALYEAFGFEKKELGFLSYRLGFGRLEQFYKQVA